MFNKALSKASERENQAEKQIALLSKLLLRYSRELTRQLMSFLPSKLIIITGVSCAGKSSLAQTLVEHDSSLIHMEVDKIARGIILQHLREIDPVLFEKLYKKFGESLAYYVAFYSENDIFSMRNIGNNKSDESAIKFFQQHVIQNSKLLHQKITYHLLSNIRANFLYGKNVLLDMVTDNAGLKPFVELRPLVVTIYTPLERLASYVGQRNRVANFQNLALHYRDPKMVAAQFALFFSRRFNANSPCLEKINPLFFESSHLSAQTQDDLRQMVPNILSDLGIHQGELGDICLKQQTRLLLNTHGMSVEKSACITENYIKNLNYFKKCKMLYGYHLQDNTSPRLILLDGLSVAGKTTTAEAFMLQSPAAILLARSERQRKILSRNMPRGLYIENGFGEDIFCFAKYHKNPFFQKLFLENKSISNAYLEQVSLYCEGNIQKILKTEEVDAAEKSRQYLNAGVTVLLDNLIFKNDLSAFSGLSPLVVLIYCPFKNVLSHLRQRNQQAVDDKPLKWRDPFKIYQVYALMFGSNDKLNCGEALEELHKAEVVEVLEKLCEMYPPHIAKIDKDFFIEDLLKKLGLDKNESVKMYPQLSVPDITLNTIHSAKENAALLLDYIRTLNVRSGFEKGP